MRTTTMIRLVLALSVGVLLAAAPWLAGAPVSAQPPRSGASAPEIDGTSWINSARLTLAALRGRVVLVEFWTYG